MATLDRLGRRAIVPVVRHSDPTRGRGVEFGSGSACLGAAGAGPGHAPACARCVGEPVRGPTSEDEKLRFILIVSAIVAALAVHRFVEGSPASAQSSWVRSFTPSGVGTD